MAAEIKKSGSAMKSNEAAVARAAPQRGVKAKPAKGAAEVSVRPRKIVRGDTTYVIEGRTVLDDLGFSRARSQRIMEEAFDEVMEQRNTVKAKLVNVARDEILSHGFNISQAADFLSMTRPRVSDIINSKFSKVSIDAIVDVVHKFGKEVRFEVVDSARASAKGEGRSTRSAKR